MDQKYIKRLFGLTMTSISLACLGQEGNPVQISYSHAPLENVEDGSVSQWEARVVLPIKRGDKLMLFTGLHYNGQSLENFPMNIGDRIYLVEVPSGLRMKLNDTDNLFLASRISLGSDLEDISSEDFTFSLGVGINRKISEKLTMGLGIGYSHQLFGNQLLPFVNFDYKPKEQIHFNGKFPIEGKLTWSMGSRNSVGMEWNIGVNGFRLSEEDFNSEYIRHSNLNSGLFYQYRLYKGLHLKLSGGVIGQKYQRFGKGDSNGWTIVTIPLSNQHEPLEELESKGLFVQMGLFYSF
ncbi:DUF6268 family outer membrane beta-barrel protein [Flagellimonas baculiformis]|uniref:DUF6268 family outer membrane beta-barrel protein n=1 Tax=Flagellimonas baculiformis TaxID=3067310 RepID=UPI00296FD9D9|nr:DUF6268 family outer membrane beta-barrel protein [Muricauda sp. D6]